MSEARSGEADPAVPSYETSSQRSCRSERGICRTIRKRKRLRQILSRERKVLKGVSLRPAGEGGRGVGEGVGGRASRGKQEQEKQGGGGEARMGRNRSREEEELGGAKAGRNRSWEEEEQGETGVETGRSRSSRRREE